MHSSYSKGKDEPPYHKVMEGTIAPSSPGYSEMWRTSPTGKLEPPRTPLELNLNSYPIPGYDMESVPNMLAFPPCTPPYKEFAVFKEKSPQDVADALLSLKHAVVHPQLSGQMSPLSPTMHLSPANLNDHSPQSLTYTINHNTPVHPMTYSTGNNPPYPTVHAQIHSDPTAGHAYQQQGMFPAMSVNVSMSMNVVPPNFGNNQYNPGNVHAQQWSHSQGQQHYIHDYNHSPQSHSQYNPYSPEGHGHHQPYFASEFRASVGEGRNLFYKASDGIKESARFYNANHLKMARFMDDSPLNLGHGGESGKVNLCRICGKTYARPSTLKTHLRTHSGEKPYKCSTCCKSFSQAANLTAHIRTHSGEKPFRCPICDRRFSQSSSVTTHMRTHSGERPYRCRLCKKAFSDSSTLTKHLRIHSGEKPYQCKLCLLRFSQSGNLNRHMRVHSNNP